MNNIDLNEEIANIKWVAEDIEVLFKEKGIPFTQENYKILLDNGLKKTLHERSIELGWEILWDILNMYEDEMNI